MKLKQVKLLGLIALVILPFFSFWNKGEEVIFYNKITNGFIKNKFKINIIDKEAYLNEGTINLLTNTFYDAYPKMVKKYNPDAPTNIKVNIDNNYKGVAFASADSRSITINAQWLINYPNDTDLLVHELMHIVQNYTGNVPGWLTEGIADYVRNEFSFNKGNWRLPSYKTEQHYTDSYGVTAIFLIWIESEYDTDLVKKMNAKTRNGEYSPDLWLEYTGFNLDDLWSIYTDTYSTEEGK